MGAPDHFAKVWFQFSFSSGCVRVRPILVASECWKPGLSVPAASPLAVEAGRLVLLRPLPGLHVCRRAAPRRTAQ